MAVGAALGPNKVSGGDGAVGEGDVRLRKWFGSALPSQSRFANCEDGRRRQTQNGEKETDQASSRQARCCRCGERGIRLRARRRRWTLPAALLSITQRTPPSRDQPGPVQRQSDRMWATKFRISASVKVAPKAGMRGERFMIAPPPAIVSYNASSDRADIASREACCAGFTGSEAALGPSPLPAVP